MRVERQQYWSGWPTFSSVPPFMQACPSSHHHLHLPCRLRCPPPLPWHPPPPQCQPARRLFPPQSQCPPPPLPAHPSLHLAPRQAPSSHNLPARHPHQAPRLVRLLPAPCLARPLLRPCNLSMAPLRAQPWKARHHHHPRRRARHPSMTAGYERRLQCSHRRLNLNARRSSRHLKKRSSRLASAAAPYSLRC